MFIIIAWALVFLASIAGLGARPFLGSRSLETSDRPQSSIESLFRTSTGVVVVLEGEAPISQEVAEPILETLAPDLARLDGATVRGRLTDAERRYLSETASGRLLLFLEPDQIAELANRLSPERIRAAIAGLREARNPDPLGIIGAFGAASAVFGPSAPVQLRDGYITDRSGKRFFLLLQWSTATPQSLETEARLVTAIDETLARCRTAHAQAFGANRLSLYALGRPQVSHELASNWIDDALLGMFDSLLFVYLAFAVAFRRPLAALAALAPIAVSLAGALALGALLFGEVHIVTLAVSVLIIGIGIDFSLHIGSHYWFSTDETADKRARFEHAVLGPFTGIFLGGLTTAIAFLSLAGSSYSVVRETGIVVAAGLLLIVLTSLSLLPALLWRWPEGRKRTRRSPRWLSWISSIHGAFTSRARRRAGLAFWILAAIAGGIGISRLEFEFNPVRIFTENNQSLARLHRVAEEVGVSFHPITVISSGATVEAVLAKDQRVFAMAVQASREANIALIESISAYIPSRAGQFDAREAFERYASRLEPMKFLRNYRNALAAEALPEDEYFYEKYPAQITRVLSIDPREVTIDGIRGAGLTALEERHVQRSGDLWYAATYIYPKRFSALEEDVKPLRDLQAAIERKALDTVFVGALARTAAEENAVRSDAMKLTPISLLGVGAMLWIGLGSFAAMLRALLPAVLATWLLAGVMGFAGIQAHVLTLAVLPLLIGLGVDNGVHIVSRIRRGESLKRIFDEAGIGMLMTAITTAAGFASFLFASNRGLREFGLCGAIGVLIAFVAAIHLVPLLYRGESTTLPPSRRS